MAANATAPRHDARRHRPAAPRVEQIGEHLVGEQQMALAVQHREDRVLLDTALHEPSRALQQICLTRRHPKRHPRVLAVPQPHRESTSTHSKDTSRLVCRGIAGGPSSTCSDRHAGRSEFSSERAFVDPELGSDICQGPPAFIPPRRHGHCVVGHLASVASASDTAALQVGHHRGSVDAEMGGQSVGRGALRVQVD